MLGAVASLSQAGAASQTGSDADLNNDGKLTGADSRSAEDALSALLALVRDDLEACNRTIVARMESQVPLIPQLAAHIVAAGGKRLRPLLTLASARMCGYSATRGHLRHVKNWNPETLSTALKERRWFL